MAEMTPHEVAGMAHDFDFWALPHQRRPDGDWRTWVILGGRGAGKTRAGVEWVRSMVEGWRSATDPGLARRVALVAETIDQAREVMVFGESGLMACSPPDRRPQYIATRKLLVWPNGAVAQLFGAAQPETLRGPQFDAAWADEFAKWPRAEEAWAQLQFALRLGDWPAACVTTTPRPIKALRRLLDRPSTVMTHAPTEANRANLAASFLEEVRLEYGGTHLARQELDGLLLDDLDGALWPRDLLAQVQVDDWPSLDRIVVAVDPPAGGGKRSDECGIVVAGLHARGETRDWTVYVLEDASVAGASPARWAEAVAETARRHAADRVVAEVNQGGAMIEALLRQVDPMLPYAPLRALDGKVVRGEPVAALYERGRVRHLRGLGELEDQMAQMTRTGFEGEGSPDRVDALVWAVTELMLGAPARARPQIRRL